MQYKQRVEKIIDRVNQLSRVSEREDCLTRTYGSPAFIEARKLVEQWMIAAGLETRIDNIGNIRGRLVSEFANAKTFVIASHIDTVVNAGKWDGPLGVIMGLDIIEALSIEKGPLPFHLEVIGFCDEEGCRFHTTYLGSKVVAGCFDENMLHATDANGNSLRSIVESCGGGIDRLDADAIPADNWEGYFEIHIEQGPVLFHKDIPVGMVTSIAGQYRATIRFVGEAGHAGTVPMNMRKDALAAAAEFILAVEDYAAHAGDKSSGEAEIVATVGKLDVWNAASNVIPGNVVLSLDLRSANNEKLSLAYSTLKEKAGKISLARGLQIEWHLVQQSPAISCDNKLNEILSRSIQESGFELVSLVSGAGHDAVPVSTVAPISLLFVRCFKGISHNPMEDVELKDINGAIGVADRFIRHLIDLKVSQP